MADKKLTEAPEAISADSSDIIYVVDDPSGSPISKKITKGNFLPGSEIKTLYEGEADTNAFTDAEQAKLSGIETGAEVNNISDINATDLTDTGDSTLHYHLADRNRANHTGTQTASTISDFDTEVANNSAVTANTAKETNATHTGDVTGSGELTIANGAVSYAKMQDVAANDVLLGNNSGPGGTVAELTPDDVRTMLGVGAAYNDIGVAGKQGFGVGVCPMTLLPDGMTLLPGTETIGHDNYGNYQFQDGSIVCYIPAHWVKIGTGSNGFDVNVFSVLKYSSFNDETEANAAGYFLPRCFKDGGETKTGYFVDKYECSKNAWGAGYIASSIGEGLPISTHADHNPIADLTACSGNYYYEAIAAAKARDGVDGAVAADPQWFCCSRFIYVNLAMLATAHGQAATSSTYCAWYDATGATNYPKGCNNNALGDHDDGTVSYTSDGYSNCGKTGSGTPFAKTTHNGQNCGVADLNGNMYEISIGVTSDGSNYYVADEDIAMNNFTAGNTLATDHWGATGIAANMSSFLISYMEASVWRYMGSGSNQVLSEALTGNDAVLTSLGLPKDSNGYDTTGTNLFGRDGMYHYQLRNELCVLAGLAWGSGSLAGVWGSAWYSLRSAATAAVSFRCACYPV
jgi:hypothetical protein